MLSRKCSSDEPSPKHRSLFQHYRSKADLTDPKSDFRFSPQSGLRADVAPCQFRAISGLMHRSNKRLFDHLVGELLQLQGHLKTERFGCREVDNQIEFSWLLYRKLAGLGSAQYLIH